MKNSVDRDAPRSLRPDRHDLRPEREHRGGMVVGGIAVGEVPADRGEVPDERIRDHAAGIGEDRKPAPHELGGLELGLADERADHEGAVPLGDRPEPG